MDIVNLDNSPKMQVRQCPVCRSQNVVSVRRVAGGQPVCRCVDCGHESVISGFDLAELRSVQPHMVIKPRKR